MHEMVLFFFSIIFWSVYKAKLYIEERQKESTIGNIPISINKDT